MVCLLFCLIRIYLKSQVNQNRSLIISETTFTNNSALTGRGGAIYIRGIDDSKIYPINLSLNSVKIISNRAALGGGIDS